MNSLLKPIFRVLSVFAYVPCLFRNSDEAQNARSSRFAQIYSVTAVPVVMLCLVLGTWEVSKLFYFSSLYYTVDIIKVIVTIVSAMLMLFCCFLYNRNIMSIIHNISIFDQTFQQMFHSYNEPFVLSITHILIYSIVDLLSYQFSFYIQSFPSTLPQYALYI
jgi:hypothetical protein